jgi:hypothetical protein
MLIVIALAAGVSQAADTKAKVEEKTVTVFERAPDAGGAPSVPGAARAQWDVEWTFNAFAAGCPGVETDGANIYTSYWGGTAGTGFDRYQMNGTFVEHFTIAGSSNSIRDMAYDGTYFYGSPASMTIEILDLANEVLIGTIPVTCTGVTGVRHIAYDPTLNAGAGGFWIGNWGELGAITMTGAQIYPGTTAVVDSAYGSAYDPYSTPGSPRVLLFQQSGASTVEIHGFDINSLTSQGLVHDASDIPGYLAGDLAGGMCTYEDTGSGLALLIGNIQTDPNLVFAYELAVLADPAAPGLPTGLAAVPDAGGALQAQVSWTNPAVTVGGAALTELTTVVLELDGVPVYTNGSPTIGGAEDQLVTVAAPGFHTFAVYGTNTAGTGLPADDTQWVGEDVPAAPGNATLNVVGTTANVDWDAPAAGLHGAYFSGTGVTYDVLRNGSVLVADDITATAFSETLSVPGNYTYTIIASNASGEGGSATTNSAVYGYLFYEDFAAAGPALPAGWTTSGLGTPNWSVVTTNNAGGVPNELRFSWTPSFTGQSNVLSPVFSTAGMVSLDLTFRHYVDYYATGISLRVFTTSDGGTTLNEVWSVSPTGNIGPIVQAVSIGNADVGSPTTQIVFQFDGYSFNIDYWYIDEVAVTGVIPVELQSFSVE